ncbi:VOC family protein [Lelliottia sp. F153]|uniref:glyoxalase superfamily protein n=1 Tax=unclassified Lelliottia TaxID=2642424 RepID=UPI000C7EFAD3|nr:MULTISPECIES: glyoxalase superfamily protein [unclassified Lelliottia]PLY47916.1 VOC family protein [Lelliottia sp. F159]PLY52395.1 VOC family protein [Lelliottia sp. F154]PLY55987.1 VOC family protein [Lelliottia sp. F153]
MLSVEQAKQMSAKLKNSLEMRDHKISYSAALETVSHQLGYRDWNTASAALTPQVPQPQIHFIKTIPILRMFDERKAREFYLDFLSFCVEFEHRFEPGLPLYLGIEREGLQLHLSEHHGDASPGATIFIPVQNIELFRDQLHGKKYGYGRPEIVKQDWGDVLEVYDPFGNRLRFCQS